MKTDGKPIFVQIDIAGSIDRLWELTQTPQLHQSWDLRFTDIEYLPRPNPAEPQRFLYATRIGFGLCIRGEGSTAGSHNGPKGERSSALKFWSADPKSLIREGSGYWKYLPLDDGGVRFLTVYDYQARFGWAGRLLDRFIFRPLMGWATAWSFDRLRLWIELGIDPAESLRRWLIQVLARGSIASVWLYQGLVPKILFRHHDEIAMLQAVGVYHATVAATVIGAIEVLIGLSLLIFWRNRWPLVTTIILMVLALVTVAITSRGYLVAAFNPVVLNLLMAVMAGVALLNDRHMPSARRCLRRPESEAA